MESIEFEWDDRKAQMNLEKHGVRFSEAATIWRDEWALEMSDPEHSDDEDRWIRLGISGALNTLVVVFTERGAEGRIRIISARRATSFEEHQYFARRS